MTQSLVLFSGGKDSLLAACLEIEAGNQAILLSCNNGALAGEQNLPRSAARLQERYGNGKAVYAGCYHTAAMLQELKASWMEAPLRGLAQEYPDMTGVQAMCLQCQTAMWAAAVAYAAAKGIPKICAGYKKSDPFCTGQASFMGSMKALAGCHGIRAAFPLYDRDPGPWEVNQMMLERGLMPTACEPKCMLGRPSDLQSRDSQGASMALYFKKELEPIAKALVLKHMPIFQAVQLSPESLRAPEYDT